MDVPNDGRFCRSPKANCFCVGQRSIAGPMVARLRDLKTEEGLRGQPLGAGGNYIPPCSAYANVFGAKSVAHRHQPPDWLSGKVTPVEDKLGPYSGFTWPYAEVLAFDAQAESAWAEPEDRERSVKDFFRRFTPKSSLMVFYYNYDNPINGARRDPEDNRYVVAGFSRLVSVGDDEDAGDVSIKRWNDLDFKIEQRVGNQVWAVRYRHDFPNSGFLLPIHELLETPNGLDKARELAVFVPPGMSSSFKYVCNELTDDRVITMLDLAVASMEEILRRNWLPEDVVQPRIERAKALRNEAWASRGVYPGVGAVLQFLGASSGVSYHREHLKKLEEKTGIDLGLWLQQGLNGKGDPKAFRTEGHIPPLPSASVVAKMFWTLSEPERDFLLRHATRMALSGAQLVEIMEKESERWRYGFSSSMSALAANPYLLYEEYRPADEEAEQIDVETVDHHLFNPRRDEASALASEWIDATDERRVSALAVRVLCEREKRGDTRISLSELSEALTSEIRRSDPDFTLHERLLRAIFSDATGHVLLVEGLDGTGYAALRETVEDERLIEEVVEALAARTPIEHYAEGRPNWRAFIPPARPGMDPARHARAATRQESACEKLFRSPISVLTGGAGVGKSTLIQVLKSSLTNFLFMEQPSLPKEKFRGCAFTGKATNNLRSKIRGECDTIHRLVNQFGKTSERENFLVARERTQALKVENLIIDEASMLDTNLFAALLRTIDLSVLKRLILVGDRFQLPPIGGGRLFVDIIERLLLRDPTRESGHGTDNRFVTTLREQLRTKKGDSDLLTLAASFADGQRSMVGPALAAAAAAPGSSDLEVVEWQGREDLLHKITAGLVADAGRLAQNAKAPASLPAAVTQLLAGGSGIDAFQILSPQNTDYHGCDAINSDFQKLLNAGGRRDALSTSSNTLYVGDKVIQLRNRYGRIRDSWENPKVKIDLFNGYQGVLNAVTRPKDRATGRMACRVKTRFEGDERLSVTYSVAQAAADLAPGFAISIHKAQGSEYSLNYFVLPRAALGKVSRELIYTGLTRGAAKTTLLVEKAEDLQVEDFLLSLSSPDNSDIERRRTGLFERAFADASAASGEPGRPYPAGLRHTAVDGRKMRSKSEMLIDQLLSEMSDATAGALSHRYEPSLELGGQRRWPDFELRHGGRTFYLEHLGLLGADEAYDRHWQEKRRWYEKNGLLDYLIVTTEKDGLNLAAIRSEVRQRLGL